MKKTLTPAEMGRKGGKRSVQTRFKGKSKEEISEIMKVVRASRVNPDHAKRMAQGSVESLRNLTPKE